MKSACRLLSIFLILILVAAVLPLSARAASDGKLVFRVSSIVGDGDVKVITITYENNTDYDVCLGWVSSCNVVVTTDENTIKHNIFGKQDLAAQRGTLVFRVEDCPGTVEKVVLSDIRTLENSLPKKQLEDVLVYDINDPSGTEYSYSFDNNFFSSLSGGAAAGSGSTLPSVLLIVGILAVIVVVVIIVLNKTANNRKLIEAAVQNALPKAPPAQPTYSPLSSEAGTAGASGAAGVGAGSDQ